MCRHMPVDLVLLHALRLAAAEDDRAHRTRLWLTGQGLEPATPLVSSLARMIASTCPETPVFARPGRGGAWPTEEALLQALSTAVSDPPASRQWLDFLPPAAARLAAALLAELAAALHHCLSRRHRIERQGVYPSSASVH